MAGCDEGTPTLSDAGAGPAPHVVWKSPGPNETNVGLRQSIRVQFDRYLLPDSAVRQGICVQSMTPDSATNDCPNAVRLAPQYDPVDRVVAWLPQDDLTANTRYTVRVLVPRSEDDVTGIRAFDGVPLGAEDVFGFTTGSSMTPTLPEPVRDIDFCFKDKLCGPLPANVCSMNTMEMFAAGTIGPEETFHSCALGSGCHGLPGVGPPSITEGSAFSLTTDTAFTGIPSAVQQLVMQSVVATETATAPNPKAAARSPGTLFAQNMPYIDGKNPGNSYLLYKLIIGMSTTTPQNAEADVYSCDALRAAGWMERVSPCTSTAPLTSTPPLLAAMGQPLASAVESWVPVNSPGPATDENVRLQFRIRGTPMPPAQGGMPIEQVRTLSAWIAAGAAANNCP